MVKEGKGDQGLSIGKEQRQLRRPREWQAHIAEVLGLCPTARHVPLDFNSSVPRRISSCTSSGSTFGRVYASSQRGLLGNWWVAESVFAFFLDLPLPIPSLALIREKILGIVAGSLDVSRENN